MTESPRPPADMGPAKPVESSSRPGNPDGIGARSAARRIALRIGLACGIAMICVFAVGTLYLLYRANRPARADQGDSASFMIRLDPPDLIAGMVILALAGVALAAAVGWLSARSAIKPLADSLARQRRFVQDASHELRTPLAILDARVQLAQRQIETASNAGQTLAKIRQDTATLTGIVEELLLAATVSKSTQTARAVEITAILAEVAESMRVLAAERQISLSLAAEQKIHVRVAESSLRRAVLALADNAVVHTPSGGQVTIASQIEGRQAVITVTDTGTGLAGVDQDRIFDRFVRGNSGEGSQRSFGIGLALVREIAAVAGGSAEVVQSGPSGTIMRISLPLAAKGE